MNNTIREKIKKFITNNTDLTYEKTSNIIDKYLDKEVEYEDDVSFCSPDTSNDDE